MKREIYFNVRVSEYFNAPFYNKDRKISLDKYSVLNCPIAYWDIDTKKLLETMEDEILEMSGKGHGLWVINNAPILQHKPDTEKWNQPVPDTRDSEIKEARNVNMLNSFMFL